MGADRQLHLRTRLLCIATVLFETDGILSVQLYRTQTSAPKVLARVARAPSAVLLELTQEAIQLGLLEPCLVATVLFVCGHNID